MDQSASRTLFQKHVFRLPLQAEIDQCQAPGQVRPGYDVNVKPGHFTRMQPVFCGDPRFELPFGPVQLGRKRGQPIQSFCNDESPNQ